MILSRNWLNEFVDLKDITDKEFNDEMTLSGSKVETIERPDENLKNVVVGKILEMKRHENSDHMWVCQIDVGQAEPVQIVTGAWNIHVGDYVPAALHGAHLPGGVKIEKGKLRGVESNGMLCSLKELGMTAEHDFPYAIITPAALLNDYHPIDPAKPSIPADIKPGDKVYGPVLCGRVEAVESVDGGYNVRVNDGTVTRAAKTACSNLHEGRPCRVQHEERHDLYARRPARRAEGVPSLHRRRYLCLTGRGRRAGPQHGAHPRL